MRELCATVCVCVCDAVCSSMCLPCCLLEHGAVSGTGPSNALFGTKALQAASFHLIRPFHWVLESYNKPGNRDRTVRTCARQRSMTAQETDTFTGLLSMLSVAQGGLLSATEHSNVSNENIEKDDIKESFENRNHWHLFDIIWSVPHAASCGDAIFTVTAA